MPFYLFIRRVRRSPAAFCGLIAIVLLMVIALFAPWLALAGRRLAPAGTE